MAWVKNGRLQIPAELARIIDADVRRARKPFTPIRRPQSLPVGQYTSRAQTPIANGYGVTQVAVGGSATVTVGPQGLGTVWYPVSAAVATTTGANDSSTVQLYSGPLGQLQLISGTSYAGGGDSIGLGGTPLTPGYYIVAVWSGGHAGDLASLAVYGTQDALVRPAN